MPGAPLPQQIWNVPLMRKGCLHQSVKIISGDTNGNAHSLLTERNLAGRPVDDMEDYKHKLPTVKSSVEA